MKRDSIAKRRAIEDRAIELGAERVEAKRRLAENTSAIVELLNDAVHHIPLEHFAQLVGVGRASLYRWLDDTKRGRAHNPNPQGGEDG